MVARRSLLRVVALGLVVAAAIAMACGPGSIEDLTSGHPDAGDGGADEGQDASICVHAVPPERPASTPDAPDGPSTGTLVFAIDLFRFGGEDAGDLPAPLGLDLDQTCTCPEPESCVPPLDAGVRACDLSSGRDNTTGPLLELFATIGQGLGPELFVKQLRRGFFTVLISIQGWNGQPDDPSVVVGVQLSSGLQGIVGNDAGAPPRFDGTDVWTVIPSSVLGGVDLVGADCRTLNKPCIPARVDTAAYVRDGVLVAHGDIPLPIRISTGVFEIDFTAATITARLVPDGASYRLRGEVTGRWPAAKVLQTFAHLGNPITGKALCSSDAGLEIYALAKSKVCAAVDLTTNPASDRTGARCDALSDALSFSATRATIGTIDEAVRAADECPGFMDDCSN